MTKDLVICGLGPIGERIATAAKIRVARAGTALGLVDRDPAVRARFEAADRETPVFASLAGALEALPGAVVVLSTASAFDAIAPDLRVACQAGSAVLTTCEEAAWPFAKHPQLSREVDRWARAAGVPIVGVGINPGFLLDVLPAVVAAPYPVPEKVLIERRVDVSTRRGPLQAKVGVGLTAAEFRKRAAADDVGHRGLAESLYLLGAATGVTWDSVRTDLEPVIAHREVARTGAPPIPVGACLGVAHQGVATRAGGPRVEVRLRMSYGEACPVDQIELQGPPPLPARLEIHDGVPGDDGTVRVVLATIPTVLRTAPGLRTVLDLPGGLRTHWG